MVDVFVIHSGKDYEYVKTRVEPYLLGKIDEKGKPAKREGYSNILTLESGKRGSWKKDAKNKIKMSQVVLFVLGDDSSNDSKKKTMGWEVAQAIKYNKQLMIIDTGKHDLPSYLYHPDRFTKQTQPIAPIQTLEEVKKRIDDFARGYYNIFSKDYANMDDEEKKAHEHELVDQYKIFLQTSEDLVARRQSVNSFYISVNSALVTLVGVVMSLVEMPSKLYVMAFMCLTGIILDISWINILDAYGTLNGAKMKVIHLMEEKLPVALYDSEWKVMSDKLNNKKYVSFTNSEKRIPRIFETVYIVCLIFVLLKFLISAMPSIL